MFTAVHFPNGDYILAYTVTLIVPPCSDEDTIENRDHLSSSVCYHWVGGWIHLMGMKNTSIRI